jgi:hypothetical protein
MRIHRNAITIVGLTVLILILAGCASAAAPTAAEEAAPEADETPAPVEEPEAAAPADLTDVTLMLDWVPNTNHTGIYVAQANGYFEEAGLRVAVIEPGEVFAEQAVVGGGADFGVSFQEQLTLACRWSPSRRSSSTTPPGSPRALTWASNRPPILRGCATGRSVRPLKSRRCAC